MKSIVKVFLSTIALCVSSFANQIQVFSTNTMGIELDQGSKFERIYAGSREDLAKNGKEKINAAMASSVIIGGFLGTSNAITPVLSSSNSVKLDARNGLAGIGGAVIGYAIGAGVTWFIADNEYFYFTLAENSKSEKTIIQTLIVANNSIFEKELEELGQTALKQFVK